MGATETQGYPVPPPQHHLEAAAAKALEALASQSDEELGWLGAEPAGDVCRVKVLAEVLTVDRPSGRVTAASGAEVSAPWRVLVLHYLCVSGRPEAGPPEVTFADMPGATAYAGVYRGRVNARLCATAGRDEASLRAGAEALGGREVEGGDAAFDFQVFPRIRVRLAWYAADEEFSPSATLLLPTNVEAYFCIEDIVVLSERLVSRLSGKPL